MKTKNLKSQETKEIKKQMKFTLKSVIITIMAVVFGALNVENVKGQSPGNLDTSFHAPSSLNATVTSIMELKDKSILIGCNNVGYGVGLYKFKSNGDIGAPCGNCAITIDFESHSQSTSTGEAGEFSVTFTDITFTSGTHEITITYGANTYIKEIYIE